MLPPAAAALLDRRADEPLHLDLDRRHPRRRPAGGARRAARQRPHPRARRRGRPPGAALHPLLGLPQRLPGLRADRRARLRLGLPRARSARSSTRCCTGVGVDAQTDSLPYASSLCGACFEVCPVRIDIPEVLVHLRAKVVDAHRGDRAPEGRGAGDAAAACVRLLRRPAARRWPSGSPAWPAGCSAGSGVRRCPAAARRRPDPRAGRGAGPGPATCRRRRGSRSAPGGGGRGGRTAGTVVSARDEILGRVRAALSDVDPARRADVAARAAPAAGRPRTSVGLFAERVADYRAVVERCSAGDLEARVRAALPPGAPGRRTRRASASTSPARSSTTA